MKIGLIDADLMWRPHANGRRYGNGKADIYPNLCIMKLSAYHKQRGDEVEWFAPISGHYDIVYVSKVFSDTPDERREIVDADEVIYGGTGYCISLKDGREIYGEPKDVSFSGVLKQEVEHIMPDYSLYPMVKDTAYGFLTRGCPRGCGFCHVKAKEGLKAHKVAELSEWWDGQRNIVLMDANIMAAKECTDLLQQLADSKAKVDINQGIDARLLTEEKVALLDKIKLSTIHFAWDDYKQKDAVLRGLRLFADGYHKKLDKSHAAQVFVLVNYDTTFEQDLERIYTLKDMHFEPYIMVYDKAHAEYKYKILQRWVNMRAIFHKIDRFEQYDPIAARQ